MIMLEEGDASVWSLEDRLSRPEELNTRSLQCGDNTGQVGSFTKGRSSAPEANTICRRACSVKVMGQLDCFDVEGTRTAVRQAMRITM